LDTEKRGTPETHRAVTFTTGSSPIRWKVTRTVPGPRERIWYRHPVPGYADTRWDFVAWHSATTWPAAPVHERRCGVGGGGDATVLELGRVGGDELAVAEGPAGVAAPAVRGATGEGGAFVGDAAATAGD
jgi:hypothetical protein